MKAFKWMLACVLVSASSASFSGNVEGVVISHYEPLQRLNFRTSGGEGKQRPQRAASVELTFDALGKSFDLQLEPNAGLLSPAVTAALSTGAAVYRGQIAGNPQSWARIVVADGVPSGLIWDGTEMLAIEAPGRSVVNTSSPVIFRFADTFIAPGTMSCGDSGSPMSGAVMYQSLLSELNAAVARGPGAVSQINFGAIGDFEFTSAMGAAASTEIIARLNNVDGIFSQQLGIQINVPVLEVNTDVADPFSDTTDASDLLGELGNYRNNTPAQNAQGLTHLFTGKDLDTTTVGIAYTGALCRSRFGAGLSEGNRGQTIDSLISAHEIGHNFGAPHDGTSGSACESEAQTFLMAPSINGSDQFSACSITEMADDIANANCISSLPSVDMTIALSGQPPTALLGNRVVLNFDVTNNGTLPASNVVADIALPNNVSFLSFATTAGSCSNGAGTVNCLLGDIAGSSLATITVSANASNVGAGIFNATVAADVDDNPGNNQSTVPLTVEPAVNLVVNAPSAAQVTVGQSTTVSATLENQSALAATGVRISISLDSGIRAVSASWALGSCVVADQQIDCTAATFAAQGTSTLSMDVSGTTVGTQGYSVSFSSIEAEAIPSDNSVNGTVSVNDGSSNIGNDDDSGGGASSLLLVCLLGSLAYRRRRRL